MADAEAHPETAHAAVVSFGPFLFDRRRRLLTREGAIVQIGSRALDTLMVLIDHAPQIVPKGTLLEQVWGSPHTEEAALRFHISALRKALGEGKDGGRYISTANGRGYGFVAPLTRPSSADDAAASPSLSAEPRSYDRRGNLPLQLNRLIGRSDELSAVQDRFKAHRIVTLTGPGGVGKTSIAIHAATALSSAYADGVWLIDFSRIDDPAQVPAMVAAALKLQVRSPAPIPQLVSDMQDRRALLVFDNCEHVAEAAAELAVAILTGASQTKVLATSREALRIQGEQVIQVRPLGLASAAADLTASQAIKSPAIELFVERATAVASEFSLSDAEAPIAAEICRALDGVPLAIELAAAMVRAFGVTGLSAQLTGSLKMLSDGRRDRPERQRTMEATLDWSFNLLEPDEQKALRRLAVFAGPFTLDGVVSILSGVPTDEPGVSVNFSGLVRKSLVSAQFDGPDVRFRLLETTRAYAFDKLSGSTELPALQKRHAEYYRDQLLPAWEARRTGAAASDFSGDVDNIRAALAWATGPGGDPAIAVYLAAASAPVWFATSLFAECHAWMDRTDAILTLAERVTLAGLEMQVTLASMDFATRGPPDYRPSGWRTTLDFAKEIAHPLLHMDTLQVIWTHSFRRREFEAAQAQADEYRALAVKTQEPGRLIVSEWLLGFTAFYAGDLRAGMASIRRYVEGETTEMRRIFFAHTGFDRRSTNLAMLGFGSWLTGEGDAEELVRLGVSEAQSVGTGLPECEVLFWQGLLQRSMDPRGLNAEQTANYLLQQAEQYDLRPHVGLALCLRGACRADRGDFSNAEADLSRGLKELSERSYRVLDILFQAELASVFLAQGRADHGLARLEAFQSVDAQTVGFGLPELWRQKARLLSVLGLGTDALDAAETALRIARSQGAAQWANAAADELARLEVARA